LCARYLYIVLMVLVLVVCSPVVAREYNAEHITFEIVLPDGKFNISAYLSVPSGEGPFPVVILLHGCAGMDRATNPLSWQSLKIYSDWLKKNNFASLIIDSLGSRGISTEQSWMLSCSNLIMGHKRTADVDGALQYLSMLRFIDQSKVVLLGQSQGASVVLNALSLKRDSQLIAAGIAIYPPCGWEGYELSLPQRLSAPLLILAGAKDKITPSKFCVAYAENVKIRRGEAFVRGAEIYVYPDALHAFDLPEYWGSTQIGEIATPIGPVGPNPRASQDAKRRILLFLEKELNLK